MTPTGAIGIDTVRQRAFRRVSGRARASIVIQGFKTFELPTQFLLSILAARALPAQQFGLATLLISVQALYYAFFTFGFDETLQRALARAGRRGELPILATAYRARVATCGAGLLLGALGAVVATSLGNDQIALSFLFLGVASAAYVAGNMYLAVSLARYSVLATSIASLLSWLVPAVIFLMGLVHTTAGYMAALAAGAVVRLLISVVWLHRSRVVASGAHRYLGDAPLLLQSARSHASIAAFNATNLVLARHGDVFVAGIVGLGAPTIGSYGLAWQITSTAGTSLLLGLGALGLSRLSEHHDDIVALAASWRRLTQFTATFSLGPLCGIVILAPEFVSLLFGTKYPDLVGLLQALAATQWASRITGAGTNVTALWAMGEMEYVARTALISAAANLVFDAVFALLLGPYGLALGSGLATVIVGFWNADTVTRELTSSSRDPGRRNGQPSKRWRHYPVGRLAYLSVFFVTSELLILLPVSTPLRLSAGVLIELLWLAECARELHRYARASR